MSARVYERACYWVRWGHRVTVITCAPNFPEGKVFKGYTNRWHQVEEMSGIRVVRVKTYIAPNAGKYRRIVDTLSYMVAAFVAGLFEGRPDMVVATTPQFFGALGGCVLAAVKRVPFVLELSDLWPDSVVALGGMKRNVAYRWFERIELWMYRRAVRIVALTRAFKENLVRRGIPPAKIGVVDQRRGVKPVCTSRKRPSTSRAMGSCGPTLRGRLHRNTWDGPCAGQCARRRSARRRLGHTIPVCRERGAEQEAPGCQSRKANGPAQRGLRTCPAEGNHARILESCATWPWCTSKTRRSSRLSFRPRSLRRWAWVCPSCWRRRKGEASEILKESGAGLWVAPRSGRRNCSMRSRLLRRASPELCHSLAGRSREAAFRYTRERQARDMLAILDDAINPMAGKVARPAVAETEP
jgi:colanic acid biosynthesis glycosyl transferase WcaI